MEEGLLWFLVFLGLCLLLVFIFYGEEIFAFRVWCWNSRIRVDATLDEIKNAIEEWEQWEDKNKEKIDEQKKKNDIESNQINPILSRGKTLGRFNSQIVVDGKTKEFLKRDGENIENEELRRDPKTNEFYIEKKWIVKDSTKAANAFHFLWDKLLNNPLWYAICGLAIICLTAFFGKKISASFYKGVETYIIAFVGLFSVLISLLFSNGIEKNKENKRLFDALCGDIKGMAMWTGALMSENNIYDFNYANEGTPDQYIARMNAKESYEVEFAKMRLLLSILAPVAKHVLRDSPSKRPNYDLLDDKYRLKVYVYRKPNMCTRCLLRNKFLPLDYKEDLSQTWGKLAAIKTPEGGLGNKNAIKVFLYEKIKLLSDKSGMDLFECVMYVLLDCINGLNEEQFIKHYGKERDLISKWQHIYGSWGTMSSLTSYTQPILVHVTIIFSLFIYMWGITALNTHDAWVKFNERDTSGCCNANDWVDENRGDEYFYTYIIVKSILQIFPFTWFWFLSKNIGKPFKKGYPDAHVISKVCRDTQMQVSNLMSNRGILDAFGKGNYAELVTACDRQSINCGVLYTSKELQQDKEALKKDDVRIQEKKNRYRKGTKDKRRSIAQNDLQKALEGLDTAGQKSSGQTKPLQLPPSGVQRRRIRYKNVNF